MIGLYNSLQTVKKILKKVLKRIYQIFLYFKFLADYLIFQKIQKQDFRFQSVKLTECKPCLQDATKKTGFDRHYIYHTAWLARVLQTTRPQKHVDISSILYVPGIISAFIPMDYYDFRPPNLQLDNLKVGHADLTKLPFANENINSLSCLHSLEHIGLGRYGDSIDPFGDIKAAGELTRVIAKGGNLFIVVPIGKPRIIYNAHRIYSYFQIIEMFSSFNIFEFSLIPDDENLSIIRNADSSLVENQKYACGCFWFKKK